MNLIECPFGCIRCGGRDEIEAYLDRETLLCEHCYDDLLCKARELTELNTGEGE
jgi:hypothetical protein